jgi:osmotically-inducible protein OsmY
MKRPVRSVLVALAALAIAATPAMTSARTIDADDLALQQRIVTALAERDLVSPRVEIDTDDGKVTLKGVVARELVRNSIVQTIRSTPGVREVRDRLRVDYFLAEGPGPIEPGRGY